MKINRLVKGKASIDIETPGHSIEIGEIVEGYLNSYHLIGCYSIQVELTQECGNTSGCSGIIVVNVPVDKNSIHELVGDVEILIKGLEHISDWGDEECERWSGPDDCATDTLLQYKYSKYPFILETKVKSRDGRPPEIILRNHIGSRKIPNILWDQIIEAMKDFRGENDEEMVNLSGRISSS